MQKLIFVEAHVGGDHGIGEVNALLEQGYRVVDWKTSAPNEGSNIHALILLEWKDEREADSIPF